MYYMRYLEDKIMSSKSKNKIKLLMKSRKSLHYLMMFNTSLTKTVRGLIFF